MGPLFDLDRSLNTSDVHLNRIPQISMRLQEFLGGQGVTTLKEFFTYAIALDDLEGPEWSLAKARLYKADVLELAGRLREKFPAISQLSFKEAGVYKFLWE